MNCFVGITSISELANTIPRNLDDIEPFFSHQSYGFSDYNLALVSCQAQNRV